MEIEAKIPVSDLRPIADSLRALGAVNKGTVRERNWVLDNDNNDLRARALLLRVRSTGGPEGILTVKRRAGDGEFKTREEVESVIASTEIFLHQMEMIGMGAQWIYEKNRATWIWRECEIALDELPEIGCFVEIEGDPDAIRRVAADIGLDCANHIDDNYLGLWQKYLAARGEKTRDMIFS